MRILLSESIEGFHLQSMLKLRISAKMTGHFG